MPGDGNLVLFGNIYNEDTKSSCCIVKKDEKECGAKVKGKNPKATLTKMS